MNGLGMVTITSTMRAARPILCLSALALALVPLAAHAGEPIDTAPGTQPGGPAMPPSAAGLTAVDRPARLGAKIMFINFDGADMNGCGGSNDPHNDCSTIFQGTVLPYTGDAVQRASVVQVIRKRVADFGVTVTDQRPGSGDYDMEMVGNWQGVENPGFAGIAPNIDCFDAEGGETSFTLEASGSADGIAEIVLQEIAHTWGLEHVDEQQDLLYPTTEGTNKTFRDECYKIVEDVQLNPTNGYCNSVHTQFCSFGWQNGYQELLYLFGESVPDTLPPGVTILEPANDAVIPGGALDLVIALVDDQSPAVISATILLESPALEQPVEVDGAYAAPGEFAFPITDLPDGAYTIRVDVLDESDNPASAQVAFTVTGNPPAGEETSGSGGVDGSGGDASADDSVGSGDSASAGDGATGDDAGVDGGLVDPTPTSAEGCDCRSGRPRSGLALALLGVLGMLSWRRRD